MQCGLEGCASVFTRVVQRFATETEPELRCRAEEANVS
jgi:hypothetical protein